MRELTMNEISNVAGGDTDCAQMGAAAGAIIAVDGVAAGAVIAVLVPAVGTVGGALIGAAATLTGLYVAIEITNACEADKKLKEKMK